MSDQKPTPAGRPTIYHLAQIAGTSPSSVSAILNGNWKKRRISATTAERVTRIAAEQGYAVNRQASMLRRDGSHVIGMVVPKYDNRYFGAIAERFEAMARARGLFPVITCTQRDPELEFEAARELVSYQADCLVVTGASDPNRIAAFCQAAGVRTVNLDLPGRLAPSVISDNFGGALALTRLIFTRMEAEFGPARPLWFVGGRPTDHNTAERLRGFHAAHAEAGLPVDPARILTPGYGSAKVAAALAAAALRGPLGMFANSTIALEGVMHVIAGHADRARIRIGCFDWDPFAALLPQTVGMARQDVDAMLLSVFALIDSATAEIGVTQVPCVISGAASGAAL